MKQLFHEIFKSMFPLSIFYVSSFLAYPCTLYLQNRDCIIHFYQNMQTLICLLFVYSYLLYTSQRLVVTLNDGSFPLHSWIIPFNWTLNMKNPIQFNPKQWIWMQLIQPQNHNGYRDNIQMGVCCDELEFFLSYM